MSWTRPRPALEKEDVFTETFKWGLNVSYQQKTFLFNLYMPHK